MKIIPLQKTIEISCTLSKELGLNQTEESVFSLLNASLTPLEINGETFVKSEDLINFIKNFKDAILHKDFSYLTLQRGLKVDRIVEIEEFVKSQDYMGLSRDVRPVIMKNLNEFWQGDFIEALLSSATGAGKGFFSECSLAYMIYNLSCYYNPQLEFDLSLGSSIIFIQQSKTETLAKRVLFQQFSQKLKESNYFKNKFKFDPAVKSELRFPKNIYLLPVGGSSEAALGMNVWGGIIDELNFMERSSDSIHIQFTGEDEYDQAERAYNSLLRRIKSRFIQKGGKIPGRLLLVSSKNYPGDFTDKKTKQVEKEILEKGKSTTFVMALSQWESIPEDRLSKEKFYVELGNDNRRSRILKDKEEVSSEASIVEVPMDYYTEFDRDLEGALKDIGNIVVGTTDPFIPYRELVIKAQTKYTELHGNRSLFKNPYMFLSAMDNINVDWEKIIDIEYIKEEILTVEDAFAVHIDVGLNKKRGDAAGLSVGRIQGYTVLPTYKYYSEKHKAFIEVDDIRAPIYHIDGALQIRARKGDEIDLNLIRDMVLWLRGHLNIKYCTLDTFQSTMMIQAFKRAKIKSGNVSVDTSLAPYTEVKLAIKDQRIILPNNTILADELRGLVTEGGKVDHKQGGSKDVSDAVAGVVYILQKKVADYNSGRRARRDITNNPNSLRKIRIR